MMVCTTPDRSATAALTSPQTPKAASPGGPVTKPVGHRTTTSVKKLSDTVSKVTRGLAGGSKAAAAKTSSSDD